MVKEYIRKYGSSSVNLLLRNNKLKWILDDYEIDKTFILDKFVLSGEIYLKLKKAIKATLKSNDTKELIQIVDSYRNDKIPIQPYLCMALYQNLTLYMKFSNVSFQKNFQVLINDSLDERRSSLLTPLLQNSFNNCLKVNDVNWSFINLSLLLVQVKYTIMFSMHSLIQPLKEILIGKQPINEFYLPTMPEDTLSSYISKQQSFPCGKNDKIIKFLIHKFH